MGSCFIKEFSRDTYGLFVGGNFTSANSGCVTRATLTTIEHAGHCVRQLRGHYGVLASAGTERVRIQNGQKLPRQTLALWSLRVSKIGSLIDDFQLLLECCNERISGL